jgi:hypothetical protein
LAWVEPDGPWLPRSRVADLGRAVILKARALGARVTQLAPAAKEAMTTIAEELRDEGLKQGLAQDREQGLEQGLARQRQTREADGSEVRTSA